MLEDKKKKVEFIGKNNLHLSSNPYLKQHAHNPVHWQLWSIEVLQYAKKNQLPLFISIGYSTCHWCHVMEEESFADPQAAKVLNKFFIPIKIDREERPDIDSYYINAAHLMGVQGGWPLNIFADHQGIPFWICTYIPPDERFNMKSFVDVVSGIGNLWKNDNNKIISQTNQNRAILKEFFSPNPSSSNIIDEDNFMKIKEFSDLHLKYYDKQRGGFKFQSNVKFPCLINLITLLKISQFQKNLSLLEVIENTVINLSKKGMYDHLGGGLFRYSTDYEWGIPHFEKMLYDNALFIELLVDLIKTTTNKENKLTYHNILFHTLNYWEKEMSANGVFYAAQDAGGLKDEGKYYAWNKEELSKLLSIAEEKFFFNKYEWLSLNKQKNQYLLIIKSDFSINRLSQLLNSPVEQLIEKFKQIENQLLEYRLQRKKPFKDKKILLGWNCLMAFSLAHVHEIFPQSNYLEKSKLIFNFINQHMVKNNQLLHSYIDSRFNDSPNNSSDFSDFSNWGFLNDYGNWIRVCLKIYQVSGERDYLEQAQQWMNRVFDTFSVENSFSEVGKFHHDSILKSMTEADDGVEPCGLSLLVDNLNKLNLFSYSSKNDKTIRSILENYYEYFGTASLSFMLSAFHDYQVNLKLITIFDKSSDSKKNKIINKFRSHYLNSCIIISYQKNNNLNSPSQFDENLQVITSDKKNQQSFIVICQNQTCAQPIYDLDQIDKVLLSL